jgi:predicted RNA-binding Zn-ribbon protein involved in translation (DUF1610 family)
MRVSLFAVAGLLLSGVVLAQDVDSRKDRLKEEAAAAQLRDQRINAPGRYRPLTAPQGGPHVAPHGAPFSARPAMPLPPQAWRFVPDVVVNVEFNDLAVTEALKRLFEDSKLRYEIDKDLNTEARITLRANKVKLGTALDMLTQTAGVNWTREARVIGTSGQVQTYYKIGSAPQGSAVAMFTTGQNGNHVGEVVGTVKTGGMGDIVLGPQAIRTLVSVVVPQERTTFRCPHCKGRVATWRSPKSNNKGAAVAGGLAVATRWNYCPLCGKGIDLDLTSVEPDGQEDAHSRAKKVNFYRTDADKKQ